MPQGKSRGASSSRWARWRELSLREQRATLAAALLIPAARLALRTRGAAWTTDRLLRRPLGARVGGLDDLASARELARAVGRASNNGPYAGNCLSRSLALLWMLRGRGIVGELRYGARTADGKLEAHAWVELNGRVLNDRQDVETRFARFGSDPVPRARTGP
ncbi:MAG TPA: lasso peptide biosynthesis B2 protein [Vicinamibacterales bacterium]|nr:lasso peptide biosynthesis B2 protein [Vicinamibacterales bacterium]